MWFDVFRMREIFSACGVFLISCDFLDYSEICTRSNSFWSACGFWVVRMRFLKPACEFFAHVWFSACGKNLPHAIKIYFSHAEKLSSHANKKSRKIACGKIRFVRKNENACERKKRQKTLKSHAEKRTSHAKKITKSARGTKELDLVTKNPHVNNSIPHATFRNHMWKLKPTSKYNDSHMRFVINTCDMQITHAVPN